MSEPLDLGDEAGVKKREKELRTARALKVADLQSIMGTKQGRRFIYWILSELCHVESSPFAHNALVMAHNAGEMNVGQRIKAEITTIETFDLYVQMLREGAAKENG